MQPEEDRLSLGKETAGYVPKTGKSIWGQTIVLPVLAARPWTGHVRTSYGVQLERGERSPQKKKTELRIS